MALINRPKGSKRRVSFRVSADLWDEYQRVKKKAIEKGYIFDPTPELIEALKKSLKKAIEELEHADKKR